MAGTALGWSSHSGWAVSVVTRGTVVSPTVLARQRVQLVDDSLPRMTYHAIADGGLSLRDGNALVARAEKMARKNAIASTKAAVEECGVDTVGVVARTRRIPDDLEKILASHALLHAAEGDLYERVLVDAAAHLGLHVVVVDPKTIEIPPALDAMRATLGPPWQKDHKLAASAALAALGR
jgi:hypothetical protein